MNRTALTLLAVLALTGCADTATSQAGSTPASPKNPLASEGNKLACDDAHPIVGDQAHVFTDVIKGVALPADAAAAAGKVQGKLNKEATDYADGAVSVALSMLADDFGRMRVAYTAVDTSALDTALGGENKNQDHLFALCQSIGH